MLRAFPHLSVRRLGAWLAILTATAGAIGSAIGTEACVPTGSAPPWDAGTKPKTTIRQAPNVLTTVFEDNFERPDTVDVQADASAAPVASATATAPSAHPSGAFPDSGAKGAPLALDAGLKLPGSDASLGDAGLARTIPSLDPSALRREAPIAASALGPNWRQAQTTAWRIEGGRLCGKGARNHGVWLERPIPINARIEFDATTFSVEGDLKAEVWGDGQSAATSVSYTNATSYLTIFGGWKNSLHVLARINEHGTDRKEIKVDKDSDDPRQHPVALGQSYRFKIERNDGKTVRWQVNGIDYLKYEDAEPLVGIGHDHFGFNDWEAKVCFDNVRVTPL